MEFYKENQTEGIPGKLTDTWYIAGSMFMTLIQYWQASGDDSQNAVVSHDLMFQAGENYDFFSSNYSQWLVRRQSSSASGAKSLTVTCAG